MKNDLSSMDPALNAALNQPGWEKTFAMAVLHADTTIRKFIWRGFRPRSTGKNEITVGDKSAADFVQEAVKRTHHVASAATTPAKRCSKTLIQ